MVEGLVSGAFDAVVGVGRMDLDDYHSHLQCDLEWVASPQSVCNTMKLRGFKDLAWERASHSAVNSHRLQSSDFKHKRGHWCKCLEEGNKASERFLRTYCVQSPC